MKHKTLFFVVLALTILGIVGRVMYHVPNVTPIVAIALFVSAYCGVRYSIPVIIAIMFVSDSIIGFYSMPVMSAVYGSFILIGIAGWYLQHKKSMRSLFVITISSSLFFFLITNWAVWQFGTMYPHSWYGLIEAYTMALPFFKNMLVGDLVYTGFFFGAYEYFLLRSSNFNRKLRVISIHHGFFRDKESLTRLSKRESGIK